MRPASIVQFERLYLLSIVIAAIGIALGWDRLVEMAAAQQGVPASVQQGVLIGAVVFAFLIPLLLLYFIARRASNIAKWIFVVFTAYSLFSYVMGLSTTGLTLDLLFAFNTVTLLLTLYCAWLLFRPDAKAWLESRGADGPGDPDTFA
ncbi:MAG: hypothetical protein LC648_05195 [Novosphingobium sp.]|nr:hypothetical protein [Novosphingobium sp.]